MNTYQKLFPPKVRNFIIEDDGVEQTFYYIRPRADEMLDHFDKAEGKKTTKKAANLSTIKMWIVHDDGTPIEDDEVAAIMAMDFGVFAKFSAKLGELMGGTAKKDDEEKNA